jgi:threonyl-tRNA synthetase
MWDRAEAMVRSALAGLGLGYVEAEGEAAFYGPKIDLQVTDPQGREETLSTVQVDFHLPGRFGLSYVKGGGRERPVMVHRSVVSTMERMVAHLLEVHNGALPVWLAPVQAVVMPVSPSALSYAAWVRGSLEGAGVRAELDDRDSTLGARVRDAQARRVPYLVVVGEREATDGSVSVRLRSAEQLAPMSAADFVELAKAVSSSRSADLVGRAGHPT